jgi:hypothetical protein
MNEGMKAGMYGVAALVVLGGAFFIGRKWLSAQLPKVQKVCEHLLSFEGSLHAGYACYHML